MQLGLKKCQGSREPCARTDKTKQPLLTTSHITPVPASVPQVADVMEGSLMAA